MPDSPLVVVKLGGSVLTRMDAAGPMLNEAYARALVYDLKHAGCTPVLVYGTGSFGKPPAVRHGYLGGRLRADRAFLVAEIAADLERLNAALSALVRAAGFAAVSFPAASFFCSAGGAIVLRHAAPLAEFWERGCLPVVGGGFVPDLDEAGYTVCSSDTIAAELAVALDAEMLVFATSACGVHVDYGRSEDVYSTLRAQDSAAISRITADALDVSGGMAGKVACGFAAAARGIDTYVIDGRISGNLRACLDGKPLAGTRLVDDRFVVRERTRRAGLASTQTVDA